MRDRSTQKFCVKNRMSTIYHPIRRERRATGAEGNRSPNASIPASTPVTIDATAAHVDITIALPCFKPRVCSQGVKDHVTYLEARVYNNSWQSNTLADPFKHKFLIMNFFR